MYCSNIETRIGILGERTRREYRLVRMENIVWIGRARTTRHRTVLTQTSMGTTLVFTQYGGNFCRWHFGGRWSLRPSVDLMGLETPCEVLAMAPPETIRS
ncbi:hypothetical protein J6590_047969 [Homalodisca vitripennis]|nr:hypothetical protein J6590_047969 [Homalodisca vitripennis]